MIKVLNILSFTILFFKQTGH